ncbi:MAG: Gfo/Idh/MocA family oxidoreductase [Acidobacteriaceae bacterium]|nr:Gfo/Idh/MocA family oxidoreductase [Acidobacteriaceae bacterium]MBV9296231.1 Gfo/Idh/MocA family oxidoreductase [Acidobacteriaceae bacterium]MBV9763444.1 Gfo/Idh/MocA family oxidoreductase [Acidobacteriaceae bacterium]
MPDGPSYAMLGRGRWAARIQNILDSQGRRVELIGETRQQPHESDASYQSRLSTQMSASGAEIAWICIPPGNQIPLMIEAAIAAGLHVVVEKPWTCSRSQTEHLMTLAKNNRRVVAIHYEYCFLEAVERWRRDLHNGIGLRFGGRFTLSRPDRLGISALENLGCHLLAIRAYAAPLSEISEISCGYDLPDERRLWVKKGGNTLDAIDFWGTHEPLIQRFIAVFEAALCGASFALNLDFASRVFDDVKALRSSNNIPPTHA